MSEIKTKRIYDPADLDDGYRVLVDRLWPRGVSKDEAAIDLWAKDIAPSDELRRWFDHKPERFGQFAARYKDELRNNPALAGLREELASHEVVTLLFGAKDPDMNQAVVLRDFVTS